MTLYALSSDRPEVDETAWVAPGAHVVGKVTLAADTSVWFGSTLRGDNEPITVGQGVNIQENCVLHTDMGFHLSIGAGCTIGHKAMLHGCTIGENALIGMGATVLNGAVIGEGALVGAGALVTEGKEIPPGVLVVGAPAKVVRDLTDAEKEGLKASALHYQENARRFRDGLEAI